MKKLQSIWTKILIIFGSVTALFEKLKPKAEVAVKVVNMLKEFVEGVVTDIVLLTPTDRDDLILAKAKYVLSKVAREMMEAEGIISGQQPATTALLSLIDYLKSKPKLARVKWYVELAGRIIQILSEGKLTLPQAIAQGQGIFEEQKSEYLNNF